MNSIVKHDLYRYKEATSFRAFVIAWIRNPGFRFSYYLRKTSRNKKSILIYFHKFMLRKYTYKFGIQIPTNTKIGKGLYIGHFGNIVINNNAIIGENCNIAHGVTIGQTNRGENKGFPTIGNKVWIGTGSVIVGNINVGNNVLIAPLTYVNKDIPSDSIAIGNPMKIIEDKNATLDYINKILD